MLMRKRSFFLYIYFKGKKIKSDWCVCLSVCVADGFVSKNQLGSFEVAAVPVISFDGREFFLLLPFLSFQLTFNLFLD